MSQRHTEPPTMGRILGRHASFWVLGFTVFAAMAVVPACGWRRRKLSDNAGRS